MLKDDKHYGEIPAKIYAIIKLHQKRYRNRHEKPSQVNINIAILSVADLIIHSGKVTLAQNV